MKAVDVYAFGKEEGFSESLLKTVKKRLGIESTREDYNSQWYWEWPIKSRVP